MFTRKEASELRQAFWTTFGQYVQPVLSAEGERINWINYKTGEKDIAFRMETGDRDVQIGIVLSHKDAGLRQLYYEQFAALRPSLESALGEEWTWQPEYYDEWGAVSARIYTVREDLLVLRRPDWPEIISFFKPRIIALDAFWSESKYFFEALRS
ncbi:DUF4268 domain-containing protein [Flaviaesturariibacter amylovorans]|uniref:DUF4268 domain-containing protein n=1 Tax=Flaviaesturariibacter amylovorans TaxID=1084520 RepID=A0ABP8GNI7_9BACT